jgi:hypothetical protein
MENVMEAQPMTGRNARETFGAVITQLEAEERAKIDLVLGTQRPNMEMVLPVSAEAVQAPRIVFGPAVPEIGGGEYEINEHAHRQIAARAQVHWNYYDRLRNDHPDLLTHTMNTLWHREPEQRLVRTLGNGHPTVRAWLSDSYRVVDNLPFLKAALVEAERQGAQVISAHCDETRLYAKLLTPRVRAVKAGDPIQAGVIIRNSEVGDGKISVSPFVMMLRCTNGAVGTKNYNRIHLGGTLDEGIQSVETQQKESAWIFSAIADWIKFALAPENLDEIVAQFAAADAVKVEAPAKLAVANVVRLGGLNKTEGDAVLERYLRANEDTQRTVVDVVTAYAHENARLSYRRQVELEEFGGSLLEMNEKQFHALVYRPLSEKELAGAFGAANQN